MDKANTIKRMHDYFNGVDLLEQIGQYVSDSIFGKVVLLENNNHDTRKFSVSKSKCIPNGRYTFNGLAIKLLKTVYN